MENTKIISLGGSIVAPGAVDLKLLKELRAAVEEYLDSDEDRRLIFIVGGGGPARAYQEAYRKIVEAPDNGMQDWIGIAATRLNAQLLAGIFQAHCPTPVVTDPTAIFSFDGRILIAAGWKPGFSTDFDAVLLAERFGADTVINLSNITKVYSEDPKKNPDARPLDSVTWKEFVNLVGEEWTPGKNLPFDPVATKKASELGLRVIVASGRDIENVRGILEEKGFEGTVIGG
jgi:uridylate kinase